MERDEPEKSVFEKNLEEMRKGQAAKYAREKEQREKERKESEKKSQKEEKPTTQPTKEEKEEETTEPVLTPAGQAKLFEEAKKALEEEGQRLKEERKAVSTYKGVRPPADFVKFLEQNRDSLRKGDEKLIAQIVDWINNNQIDITWDVLSFVGRNNYPRRIFHALLAHPRTERLYFSRRISSSSFLYSLSLLFGAHNLDAILGDYEGILDFNSREALFPTLENLVLSRHLQEDWNPIIKITKDLNIIKMMLLLANMEFKTKWTSEQIQQFVKQLGELTGNETAPDGTTALMLAVSGGYLELVRELLRRGANPFLPNRYGDNALSVADIQYRRAQTQQDFELQSMYRQIQHELDNVARERAIGLARAIRILQTPQRMRLPDGTPTVRPGLPYEAALQIVLADVNEHEQQRIIHYLQQLTEEEIAPVAGSVEPGQPEIPATPQTTQEIVADVGGYVPAWARAALVATLGYLSAPRQ
jgi:hypothetical protein